MAKNSTRYTYIAFANDVKGILSGEVELTAEVIARVTDKANDLIATQESKAAYNKANPKKSEGKGASDATKAIAEAISTVLTSEPMTAAEINTALSAEYSALNVANAVKFMDGVQSTKVVRETVNGKGLKSEKMYTAYFRA